MHTSRLDLQGTSIAYTVHGGAGSPVVLVAPMGSTGRCWRAQVEALRPHHRVLTFDAPGLGQSGPLPEPFSLSVLADLTLALIDALDWTQFHLVGMSFGGAVSQQIALRAPDRLLSLTLIATAPRYDSGSTPLPGALLYLRHQLALRMGWENRRKALFVRLLYSSGFLRSRDASQRQALAEMWGPAPAREVMQAQVGALTKHDVADQLSALCGVRTLLVRTGPQDGLLRDSYQQRLDIPGATAASFPDSGHAVTVEHEAEVNRLLMAHLDGG